MFYGYIPSYLKDWYLGLPNPNKPKVQPINIAELETQQETKGGTLTD
jgi:hypothetical protein